MVERCFVWRRVGDVRFGGLGTWLIRFARTRFAEDLPTFPVLFEPDPLADASVRVEAKTRATWQSFNRHDVPEVERQYISD